MSPAWSRIAAGALVLACAAASGSPRAAESGAQTRPLAKMIDPVGFFLPIKAKIFKDLHSIEISGYDRARARDTAELYALVHMKKEESSALQPLGFRLVGLQVEFKTRSSADGTVYRFRGRFTRGGYLDTMEKSDAVILQGVLEALRGEEVLRQEPLEFKFRPVTD